MSAFLFRRVTLGVLAATFLAASGCEQAKDSSGGKGASSARAGESQAAEKNGDRISIDELLSRTDITEAAKASLQRAKNVGQTSLARENAEIIIKNSYRLQPEPVDVKTRNMKESTVLPSLSRHDEPVDASLPDDVLSINDYLKRQAEFGLVGIEHFKTRPVYDLSDATRQDCVEWMQRIFKTLPYADSAETWGLLAQRGDELQGQSEGLQDEPMFCLCRAIVAGELKDQHIAADFLRRATKNFSVSHYPTRLPILCYRYYDRYVTLIKRDGYVEQIAAFMHWIDNDMRTTGHEQRFVLDAIQAWISLMYRNNDISAITELWQIVPKSKRLTPWQREMIMGILKFETGYFYRGGGYAHTVTDEGREKMELYCEGAHKHFEKALEITPQFPEAAKKLMVIASFGHSDREEEEWFELATKFETDYLPAYRLKQDRLRARWGGSPQEQLDFFMEQSKRHDGGAIAFLLPESLFRLRWQEEMEPKAWEKFIAQPKVASQVSAVLDKIIDSGEEVVVNGRIQKRDFFLTVKAYFAFASGQYELAEAAFDELNGRVDSAAVTKLGLGGSAYELLRSSAYAFTCEYQDKARELKELLGNSFDDRSKNKDEILALTDGLSDWVDEHSGGLYFKLARQRALLEAQYASGEQVDLVFDENFTLWNTSDFTQNTYLSPASVMFDNRLNNPKFSLILNAKTHGDKILAADFELPVQDDDADEATSESLFCPSIVIGRIHNEEKDYFHGFTIGISRTPQKELKDSSIRNALSGKLCFGSQDIRSPLFQYYFDLKPGKNRVKVFFGDKYTEIYVNDQFVCRSFSKHFKPIDNIQIAQPGAANGRGTAKVSNLTLQRWKSGPPPTIDKDAKALVEYYSMATKESPEDRWPVFWLAHSLHLQKDYDAAIPLYEKAIAMGITPKFVGFYLGDALARAGKNKQAMSWYDKVLDSQAPSFPTVRQDSKNYVSTADSVLSWAAFRLKWSLVSQAGGVERSSAPLKRLNKFRSKNLVDGPSFSTIAFHLVKSPQNTPERIRETIETHLAHHDKLNTEQKEKISPLLEAISNGQSYVESPDHQPLYLSFENKEKFFFPHFERQHLHFRWRHFYERLVNLE